MSRRCRQARAVMPYVDGELSTDDALRFEEHLVLCAGCRAAVGAQRLLEEALVTLPQPRLPAPDRERLLAGIGARLAASPVAATAARPRLLRIPVRRAAAGSALLAAASIVALVCWLREERAPDPAHAAPPSIALVPLPSPAPSTPPSSPEAPPAVIAPTIDPPAVNGALLLAAHEELTRIVVDLSRRANALANDDRLATFCAATQPLRAAGLPLSTVLATLLTDPDPALACAAADLLARGAAEGDFGREAAALVPKLEEVMRRPDRGVAMVGALAGIGTPRAWQAIGRAAQMRHLRGPALRALAGSGAPARLERVRDELVVALAEPDGGRLVESVLEKLVVSTPEHLRLLADLARRGADGAPIAAALARGGRGASELLALEFASRDRAARRDALFLVPLAHDETLAGALAPLLARSDESAAAIQALGRLGGSRALELLVGAAADPTQSNSRGRAVAAAFSAALDATADLERAFAAVREQQPDRLEVLGELVRVAPGAGGRRARALLLDDVSLPRRSRAALALEAARRREPLAPAQVAEWLRAAPRSRPEGAPDQGLTAALLVLLYAVEGDAGLERGAGALGLELRHSGRARLRDVARLVVAGPDARRDLARMEALLHLAP